jgi:hypothetical protein
LEFELHHMTNDSFRQGPVETYVLYPIKWRHFESR